jgi:hypothetical protein
MDRVFDSVQVLEIMCLAAAIITFVLTAIAYTVMEYNTRKFFEMGLMRWLVKRKFTILSR